MCLKKLKWGSIFFLFIVVMVVSACSSKSDVTDINLAEVTRSVFYTPQYVAIENGYFEEEGLNVDLTTTWGGDTTMTALLSDNADIALVGSETSIYVYAQEATDPVIKFVQLTQTDGTFFVSISVKQDYKWTGLVDSIYLWMN